MVKKPYCGLVRLLKQKKGGWKEVKVKRLWFKRGLN